MKKHTDVFIIGAGPAGLAAAIAARQYGFDVMVADGAKPPIDKACGEGLMPDSVSALQDLGVNVSALDGFPFRGIRFLHSGTSARADFSGTNGMGLRRTLLHDVLVEKARSLGAHFLWETPVSGVCDNSVLASGEMIRARWIVGADGVRSRVRHWCGLDSHMHTESRYASRRHFSIAPWSDEVEIHWGHGLQAYVTPVDRKSVCVVVVSRRPGVRLDSLPAKLPELAKRLESATCIGAERGAVTTTRQLRAVYRGAVALVGDASGSIDAITGDGLNLSFRQAMALASAMHKGDLSIYERAHRKLSRRPMYMARLLLLLDSNSLLRERTIRTLAAYPDIFSRLLRLHVGAPTSMEIASASALLGWRLVTA